MKTRLVPQRSQPRFYRTAHMFLNVPLKEYLNDYLGAPREMWRAGLEDLAEALGRARSLETIRKMLDSGRFPVWAGIKLQAGLEDKGHEWAKELTCSGQEVAGAWLGYFMGRLDNGSQTPIHDRMMADLARRDLAFIASLHQVARDQWLALYQNYLLTQVFPVYCVDPAQLSNQVLTAKTKADWASINRIVTLEELLYRQANLDAEYVYTHLKGQSSLLAKLLPKQLTENTFLTSKEQYFSDWFETLDAKISDVVGEMIDYFGEAGDVETGEGFKAGSLTRKLHRCTTENNLSRKGEMPSWDLLIQMSSALYDRACEMEKFQGPPAQYTEERLVTFAGVRVLDKLLKDFLGKVPTAQLMGLMDSYQARFDAHFAVIKKEADKMPASNPSTH